MIARWMAGGMLTVAAVVASGVWLGHRLDPTWSRRNTPLLRALPFDAPAFVLRDTRGAPVSTRELIGRSWVLELAFPGCGGGDDRSTSRIADAGARAWVTLRLAGDPGSATLAGGPGIERHVVDVDWATLTGTAVAIGLAPSAREAGDGRLDGRRWLLAVDAAGRVRSVSETADGLAPIALPDSPGRLCAFSAVDQDGRPMTERDLAGHPVVADFIFTRCMGACPMLTARLAGLRRLIADPIVRFVSFSVDPAYDTPGVLKAYAAKWGAPDARWRLLAMDAPTVRAVARSLGQVVGEGAGPGAGPILHSDRFVWIDASGVVRGSFASGDPESLRKLASALQAPGVAATGQLEGARLYASLGCSGCHQNPGLAPRLGRVADEPYDEPYLRQSILSPQAAVVAGFRPIMPSYAGLLSDRELASLVSYLKTLN